MIWSEDRSREFFLKLGYKTYHLASDSAAKTVEWVSALRRVMGGLEHIEKAQGGAGECGWLADGGGGLRMADGWL